jgi:hypothetical protein
VSSFVEEKGLAENTISFEEDFETEMRFLYYKQFDCGDTQTNSDDVGWVQYPKIVPDVFNGTANSRNELSSNFVSVGTYQNLYSSICCDCGLNMNFSNKPFFGSDDNLTTGANGQLGYLMETCKWANGGPDIHTYYRPVYGKKIIKVNAGNYSVDSLANIISEQMNGSIGAGNNSFSDALLDKLYRPEASFNGTGKFFNTLPFFRNITGSQDDVLDKDIFGTEKVFTNGVFSWARKVEGMTRQIYYSKYNYYDVFLYNQLTVDEGGRLPPGGKYPNDRTDTENYHYRAKDQYGDDFRTVTLEEVLQPSLNSGNSAAVNFYIGANHLYSLFENENEMFFQSPDLANGTMDIDHDPVRPPNIFELMQLQVGNFWGVTPFYSSNGAAYAAKYPLNTRIPDGTDALTFNTLWPVNGPVFPGPGNLLPSRNKFAGTSVAEMTFSDSQANRFAFQNFHEFYKLPNITPDGKSTTSYGGQQATMFNNPFYNDTFQGDESDNNPMASNETSTAVYPIDSSSGIMVNNFCFDLCRDTAVYKDLVAKIRALDNDYSRVSQLYREKLIYDLLTKPFDEFFPDDETAQAVFENSLWHRLGFSYEQLGQISKQVESTSTTGGGQFNLSQPGHPGKLPRLVGKQTLKNKGIITHNQFDFSKIVSSDGLGVGNPVQTTAGVALQNYRLADYYYGASLPNNLGVSGNSIHLLADSKPLNAANLPSLSAGKSYLLIESDIVKPNFKDVRAGWGNLLGIMSKENATNDTIFGAEPIDFTITEPRLLSDITLYIKNPDGTLADDSVVGKNCGFILQITKPIKPQEVAQIDPP